MNPRSVGLESSSSPLFLVFQETTVMNETVGATELVAFLKVWGERVEGGSVKQMWVIVSIAPIKILKKDESSDGFLIS